MNTEVNIEIQRLLLEKGIDTPVRTTIADVVMILYRDYGIWIIVNIAIDNKWYFELFNLKDKRNAEILPEDEYWYNSPIEVYEASILYTLKNLI